MLDVIIVGAGVAGLSAATSLRRAGHSVRVYERSSMANQVGAAISVPPNAARFLMAWGLDPQRWRFTTTRSFVYKDRSTLEAAAVVMGEDTAMRLGGTDHYFAHRVDLHNALMWLATREDGPGKPVVVYPKSSVAKIDLLKPSITLDTGEECSADLIVGADGVHSVACEAVLGFQNEPVPPAHFNWCYRFLISAADLESDPNTRSFNSDCVGGLRVFPDNETSRRIVSYPCRDETIHNFVLIFYDDTQKADKREDWHANVDMAQVLARFHGFHPQLLKIVSKATEVKQFPLLYRKPIATWHKGNVVLAGDAAHPMLPHQGQGGAMALEDGFTLGVVLHGASKADLEQRLQLYTRLRQPRTSVVQMLSNVGQDQSHLIRKELLQYLTEDEFPDTPIKMNRYSYGFDAVRTTVAAMKEYDATFELPVDFFEAEVARVPEELPN